MWRSLAMPVQRQIQSIAIVILGNFNPAIFHPTWFSDNNLIREQEAEAANLEIIHPEVAQFSTEWFQFQCTRNRLQVGTLQEAYYEALRDLVSGTLELLSHTPLTALGVNHHFDYLLPSEQY